MVSYTAAFASLLSLLATTALSKNVIDAYPDHRCSSSDQHLSYITLEDKHVSKVDGIQSYNFTECRTTQWRSNITEVVVGVGGMVIREIDPGCWYTIYQDDKCAVDLGLDTKQGEHAIGRCWWFFKPRALIGSFKLTCNNATGYITQTAAGWRTHPNHKPPYDKTKSHNGWPKPPTRFPRHIRFLQPT
ncbi:uncharacterized protein BDZ99DRAFT_504571 [Mytilinidion resinicola]|uniref:Ecp2 effector protein domain-containing protein n=1 Tax=Mytilinidion resinicola TaxID=574789 RepID=A0A6A6XYV0_9PEZI|nr:uncharacterized protein BDZ99DRAFT_504571 [Mytilinidion resinicola]KAF2801433.1 hypothetical protein BDZ99DRAFT_504571 [Mytilinidion resinicola]